jgi:hypothetical protein
VGNERTKEEVVEGKGGEGSRKVGEPSIVVTAPTVASCVRTYERSVSWCGSRGDGAVSCELQRYCAPVGT